MTLTIPISKPFKDCSIAGCDEPIFMKGVCEKHWLWLNNPNMDFYPTYKMDRIKIMIQFKRIK